jgi:hypothetical protein
MRALLLGSESSLVPLSEISAPPMAATAELVVFCAKMQCGPVCWQRLVHNQTALRPHTGNRNSLVMCSQCPKTGATKLFARCFSDKCTPSGKSKWVQLLEEHAALLPLAKSAKLCQ